MNIKRFGRREEGVIDIVSRSQCPEERKIEGRQAGHKIIWRTEPWGFLRLLFLSLNPLCSWCSNIASVVAHPPGYPYGDGSYTDFAKCGCYSLCVPCNNAEFKGKRLCPRCRQQNHYVSGTDDVCWSCKPVEERERLVFGKEHRNRRRNAYNKRQRQRFKEWLEVKRNDND